MRADLLTLDAVARRVASRTAADISVVEAPQPGYPLRHWLAERVDQARKLIGREPAVLFRGFSVGDGTAFESAVLTVTSDLDDAYTDLPLPTAIHRYIRDATPYPAAHAILFHNEGAHLPRFPPRIWFHCQTPSATGGETPVVSGEAVLRRLNPRLRADLTDRGVRYVRTFHPHLDVSWPTFFRTDRPAAVDALCRRLGMSVAWHGDVPQLSVRRPAVVSHPVTGYRTVFHQIFLHHPACLDPDTRGAVVELFGLDRLPRAVTYADGTPIPDAAVEELLGLAAECATGLPWQRDDVLVVDNIAMAHARRPFTGPRRINVALGRLSDGRRKA